MGREDPQLKLRLTEEMKDAITAAARENGRSVNAEIVARLTDSLRGHFFASDEITDMETKFDAVVEVSEQVVQELRASTQRESELRERLLALVDALSKANANNERLIALVEAKLDVSQEA